MTKESKVERPRSKTASISLRRFVRYFIVGVMMLGPPTIATAHSGHAVENQQVTLRLLGDRIAVDHRIETVTAGEDAPDQMTADDRASVILAMQRLRLDGRELTLRYRGTETEGAVTVYRYDTGPQALPAGEYELDYLTKYGLFANEFRFQWLADAGSHFVSPEPTIANTVHLTTRIFLSGNANADERQPQSDMPQSGRWAGLVHKIRHGQGFTFWLSILGLSFVFGMLHALGPGHGKSLAAAYLVNRQGISHAFLFAGSTTITHTLLAFVLAFLAYLFGDTFSQPGVTKWLQLGSGLLMLFIGGWLFFINFTGRHVHLFGGHDHDHDHEHGHDHVHPPASVVKKFTGKTATMTAIGIAHTPYRSQAPYQPAAEGAATKGEFWIELDPTLAAGTAQLDTFSHVYILSHLNRSRGFDLAVRPPWLKDKKQVGLFATRAPNRPNPIGLTRARILRVDGNRIFTGPLDLFDGTPILDVKPYVHSLDVAGDESDQTTDLADAGNDGWLEGSDHLDLHRRGVPHAHPGQEHAHTHAAQDPGKDRLRSVLLGMAGGAVPCPDALVILFVAMGAGRTAGGLAMVTAFSLGLALVLFMVGLAVMNVNSFLARVFSLDTGRFTRIIAVFSASAIMVIGLLFAFAAIRSL